MDNKKPTQNTTLSTALRFRYVVIVTLSVLATGSIFYHYFQKLNWLDAIYFSVITLTTVGYGDIVPTTPITKIFTIFYVLIGVGIIATSLNIIVRIAAERRMPRRVKDEIDKGKRIITRKKR